MLAYKHKRLTATPSVKKMKKERRWKVGKPEAADGVVRLVKSRQHTPYSNGFEKKLYVRRNGELIEERLCYNTRLYVRNKNELSKLLKLLCSETTDVLKLENEFYTWESIEEANAMKCSDFVRSYLCNVISIDRNDIEETEVFILNDFSCHSFQSAFHIDSDNHLKHITERLKTLSFFQKFLSRNSYNAENIGRIHFSFTSERSKTTKFFVTVQLYKKETGFKHNVSNRFRKCLLECTQTIRRYNLPLPKIVDDVITRHNNNMQELLELDIFNWKFLGYKFRNAEDEAFYKQIRRKNRTLSEV